MAGQPGRSGGHNRKSLHAHWLAGTHRRDRHGPLTGPPEPAPEAVYDWEPTPADLEHLGTDGRAFLRDALAKREFNFIAGRVLLDAAHTVDMLRAFREDIEKRGLFLTTRTGTVKVNPIAGAHQRSLRWLAQLM